MRDDSLVASVNYDDYEGTAAADRHDQKSLKELAKKYGVDTERYFVFGVNFHIGETHDDELAHTFVSILAIDMQAVKAGSVDFISNTLTSTTGCSRTCVSILMPRLRKSYCRSSGSTSC